MEFLKVEKWNIFSFFLFMIILLILSYILTDGPATYSGPIGITFGYIIYQWFNFRKNDRD